MMPTNHHELFKQLIPFILLLGLFWLSYLILESFLESLIWAFILAYVTWPLYRWFDNRLNAQPLLSASLMTLLISLVILVLIYGLAGLLQEEVKTAYQTLYRALKNGELTLPEAIRKLPGLGHYLQAWLDEFNADKASTIAPLINELRQWVGKFATFLGSIGHYILKLGVVLVVLFFCYRDGEEAIRQVRSGILRYAGQDGDVYLHAVANTTLAVVYGMVLAALSQGILAGVGYAFVGVDAPILFGALTALLALIPMGATLVWIPTGIALILSGDIWEGAGLLVWGFTVVSTVDNLIRTIVISGASKVSFLVVIFGVLGGLTAFGAVGLFIGPIILAVLLTVWQQWIEQQTEETEV